MKNLIMDKAYEGNETRHLVLNFELTPIVPPKPIDSIRVSMTGNLIKTAMR